MNSETQVQKIQLVDLHAQYATIRSELEREISSLIDSCEFIQGKRVKEFESAFAKSHNVKFGVGVSNGTTAVELALKSIGIKPGDEVITSTNTFFATVEAIHNIGAVPILCDIDPETYLINANQIESKTTPKTKALLPVHIYGQMADMTTINKIAKSHNLKVVEDAAQAHYAKYEGLYPGQSSNAACFSFYPGKNLGAMGDAGAVITNNEQTYALASKLRNHGRKEGSKYEHDVFGYNMRMDEIQAAVLKIKLKYIAQWTETRRKNAKIYNEYLKDFPGVQTPKEDTNATHVYHLYVVKLDLKYSRDNVLSEMKKEGINCGIHYQVPIHLQPAFQSQYGKVDLPIAAQSAQSIISLPMYAELSQEQIEHVTKTLKKVLSK